MITIYYYIDKYNNQVTLKSTNKIIEYNPINCAGIYASDYSKIINHLANI